MALKTDWNKLKIVRWWKGGLWILFMTGKWEQCEWVKEHPGYIKNKYTGGMFHVKFNGIKKLENYRCK